MFVVKQFLHKLLDESVRFTYVKLCYTMFLGAVKVLIYSKAHNKACKIQQVVKYIETMQWNTVKRLLRYKKFR